MICTILSCFDLTGAVVHEGKPQRQHQQWTQAEGYVGKVNIVIVWVSRFYESSMLERLPLSLIGFPGICCLFHTFLLRYDECTHSLREIYEDKDGGRKEEVCSKYMSPKIYILYYLELYILRYLLQMYFNTTLIDIYSGVCSERPQWVCGVLRKAEANQGLSPPSSRRGGLKIITQNLDLLENV